jgi:hypothetical protein
MTCMTLGGDGDHTHYEFRSSVAQLWESSLWWGRASVRLHMRAVWVLGECET